MLDFGQLNLAEEATLEIKDLGLKTDEKNGLAAHCYDFYIENIEEFPTLVSITLPYEPMDHAAERLFVQYYHQDTQRWELLYSQLNEAEKSITFYTDHFSTFAVFDYFEHEKGYNSGPLAPVRFNAARLDRALEQCPTDAEAFINYIKAGKAADSKMLDIAISSLDVPSNIVSASDNTVKLVGMSGVLSQELSKSLGSRFASVGAGLVAIKVGMSWYQSGSLFDALQKHRYDLAEVGLGLAASSLGFAPLAIAAASVWMVGAVDQKATDVYNKGYEGPIEHAYQLFTFEYVVYSQQKDQFSCRLPSNMPARAYFEDDWSAQVVHQPHVWGAMLKKAFKDNQSDPVKIFQAFDRLIERYVSVFWRIKPEIRKLIAEDIHRADPWREPTWEEVKVQKEKLTKIVNSRLKLFYEFFYERCIIDARQIMVWEMKELEEQMNTVTEFQVFLVDEKGEEIPLHKTEYKDYIAAFAPSPGERPTIWSWMPGSKENGAFRCTLYNYLALGAPACVKFYETWEDQVADKAAFSLSFTYEETRVDLKIEHRDIDAKWFEGDWAGLNADYSFRLDIIDQTRCSYTGPVTSASGEKILVTTYSSYVFHKESESLDIAISDDNDQGGRVWIPETTFYGRQEDGIDYIQNDKGDSFQRVK